MSLLPLAVQFTYKIYQNKVKKLGNIPYVFHLFDVAIILANYGFKESLIIAGLLHDSLEDKVTHYQTIKNKFGQKVANIVLKCSALDGADWHERKQNYLKNLDKADSDNRAVICADKISNLKATYRWQQEIGSQVWQIFTTGKRGQKWYHQELLKKLYLSHPIYQEFKYWVNKVFIRQRNSGGNKN